LASSTAERCSFLENALHDVLTVLLDEVLETVVAMVEHQALEKLNLPPPSRLLVTRRRKEVPVVPLDEYIICAECQVCCWDSNPQVLPNRR
jgi:hypothetical protein